jgi:predicted porin
METDKMNKTLLSVAVAAALAAGSLAAQAEVKIYGKMHYSVDSIDDGNDSYLYGSNNSSRIGFKGSEDLGGMKGIFKIESSVGSGGNLKDSALASRNTYVGLKGGFGQVIVGYHDTPFKTISRKADLFGDQVGDSRNLLRLGGWDERETNTILYSNQMEGGIGLAFAYVLEDGTEDNNVMSLNVTYKGGPLWVGFGYESQGEAQAGGPESATGMRLAAKYKMGAIQINGLYQSITNNDGADGADSSAFGLGGAFKTGGGKVKAQFYSHSDDADDSNGTLMALGYDHMMSKNTTVYAAYAASSNDDFANFSATGGGHGAQVTPALGESNSAISFGVVHKF